MDENQQTVEKSSKKKKDDSTFDSVETWEVDSSSLWKKINVKQNKVKAEEDKALDVVNLEKILTEISIAMEKAGGSGTFQEDEEEEDKASEAANLEKILTEISIAMEKVDASGTFEADTILMKDLRALLEESEVSLTEEILTSMPELADMLDDFKSFVAQTTTSSSLQEEEVVETKKKTIKDNWMIPSEEFESLDKKILEDGPLEEHLESLNKLATDSNDPFAKEKMAYLIFFEPKMPSNRTNLTQAFQFLQEAAESGLENAQTIAAMLDLIEFGPAKNTSWSSWERQGQGGKRLLSLASKRIHFMASLVVGYRIFSGQMVGQTKSDPCNEAIFYYHRCAEDNIHLISSLGGEQQMEVARLSDKWIAPSQFEEPQDDVGKMEYYRSLSMNRNHELWGKATQRLGEIYFFGDEAAGIPRDQEQAAQYFRDAADAGEPLAQANLGMMYANGVGVPQDNATALKYFELAAAQGNGFAMHGIGYLYYVGKGVEKNETLAMEYFEKAVALGFQEAHTYLGNGYMLGQGVAINQTKSFQHFLAAAETGSSQSIFNLGVMYYRGAGTPHSCDKALHQFRQVAINPALLMMAGTATGTGTATTFQQRNIPFSFKKGEENFAQGDFIRAFLNYRLVAEFGSEDALVNAAFILQKESSSFYVDDNSNGTDTGTTITNTSTTTTTQWFKHFVGVQKEHMPLMMAYHLYSKAALMNDKEAIRQTGRCFHEPWHGVCLKNDTLALRQYQLAADLGDSEAAYYAGMMYLVGGDGIQHSIEQAKVIINLFLICCSLVCSSSILLYRVFIY
jgi:TPR repeat protein